MIIQYIAAGGILSGLAAMLVCLQVVNRREIKRRSCLTTEEQNRMGAEDASWSQKFGF